MIGCVGEKQSAREELSISALFPTSLQVEATRGRYYQSVDISTLYARVHERSRY